MISEEKGTCKETYDKHVKKHNQEGTKKRHTTENTRKKWMWGDKFTNKSFKKPETKE